jgi:hypothetical protein
MHAPLRFLLAVIAIAWMGTATDRNSARPRPVEAAVWTELLALEIDRIEDAAEAVNADDLVDRARDAGRAVERLQASLAQDVPDEQLARDFADIDHQIDELTTALALLDGKKRIPGREVGRIVDNREHLRLLLVFEERDERPAFEPLVGHVLIVLGDEAQDLRKTVQCVSTRGDPNLMMLDDNLRALVEATEDLRVAPEANRAIASDGALERSWQKVARCLKELEPSESILILRRAGRMERLLHCLPQPGGAKAEHTTLVVRS